MVSGVKVIIVRVLLGLAWLAVFTAGVAAQGRPPRVASPFLPVDHWSLQAVRRLDAWGAAPAGFDVGTRSLRVAEVAWVLESAARRARDPAIEGVARAYSARFAEELGAWLDAARSDVVATTYGQPGALAGPPAAATGAAHSPEVVPREQHLIAGGWIRAGYARWNGRVLAGVGYSNVDDWTGTFAEPDYSTARGDAFVAVGLTPGLAIGAAPFARSGSAALNEGQAVLEWRKLGLWGGRRALGFGPAAGGGIVLSGDVALGGGGIYLREPVLLPGFLRGLGPLRAEMFLSQVTNGDRIRDPWFLGTRISIAPAERLRFGVNRGALFGGQGNAAITLDHLWLMFRGEHAGAQGEFANQLLSLDAHYRLPIGIPLVAYAEWGTDDLSGGYWRSPALLGGLELAALPGVPQVSVGVEVTNFGGASHKNPMWYRNWAMRGGWTDEGHVLGHPLAGHGREWLVFGGLDVAQARLRVDASVRFRDRGEENLYAPERTGRSTSGAARIAFRAGRRLELSLEGDTERGSRDWRASSLFTGARVLF
jgi:hypothetical protein